MKITKTSHHLDAEHGNVIAVLQKGKCTDFFLEVATITGNPTDQSCISLCELVGASVVQKSGREMVFTKASFQVTASTDLDILSRLEWNACGYRRPKAGKRYQSLPETVLIGSVPRTSRRLCYTRSFLRTTCLKDFVDKLFVPIYAILHDIVVESTEYTTWKPHVARQCTTSLRDRIMTLAELCAGRDVQRVANITRSNLSLGLSLPQKDVPRDELQPTAFYQPLLKTDTALSENEILGNNRAVLPPEKCAAVSEEDELDHRAGITRTSNLLDLPCEIRDLVLDLVLDDDLLTQATGLGNSESLAQPPSIFLTCRSLRRSGLKRMFSQELLIRSKAWAKERAVAPSVVHLLQHAKKVRIDFFRHSGTRSQVHRMAIRSLEQGKSFD